MLDRLLSTASLPLLERQAVWGEVRHGVLAGNLANIDTPGFVPRDLDAGAFRDALARSVAARTPGTAGAAGPLSRYPGPHAPPPADPLKAGVPDGLLAAAPRDPGGVVFQDDADRSVEREVLALTRNAMQRRAAVQLISAQLAMLQTAVGGRA